MTDNSFDVKKHFNSDKANDYDSIIRKVIPGYDGMHDMVRISLEENNLSETVYFVPSGKGFHLRGFTPCRTPAFKARWNSLL